MDMLETHVGDIMVEDMATDVVLTHMKVTVVMMDVLLEVHADQLL